MSKSEKKSMTKDRLIGMQVIDSEGYNIGEVLDIAFTVGKVGMTLIVETKKGENTEIAWEKIQAAGDFVVLKPSGQAPTAGVPSIVEQVDSQAQLCQTCGGPLTYVPQYQRWYCYKCGKYA